MNDQIKMFADDVINGQPIYYQVSRRDDPVSSHLAENEINRSGKRKTQLMTVYKCIQLFPGCTSKELTQFCIYDRYQIARRLADLKNIGVVRQGPIRKCRIGGRPSVTWFLK
ncbi:MAG: MarR family transcriptional regulator [Candidatus Hodarchaeales archaeon]|jgi:hypothetical protein